MKAILSFLALSFIGSVTLRAQPVPVNPLGHIKSIDSNDPFRFFNPIDPGVPLGDINGDGVDEFFQAQFKPFDARNNTGDTGYRAIIYQYTVEGEPINHENYDDLYHPAGDFNGDGRTDIFRISGSQLVLSSWEPGDYSKASRTETTITGFDASEYNRFETNADFDQDGFQDILACKVVFTSDTECHVIFGTSNPGSSNIIVEEVPLEEAGITGSADIQIAVGNLDEDAAPEFIILHTFNFPLEATITAYDVVEEPAKGSGTLRPRILRPGTRPTVYTGGIGSSMNSATNMRLHILNSPGETSLVFSRIQRNNIGFQQVFFNPPRIFLMRSLLINSEGEFETSDIVSIVQNAVISQVLYVAVLTRWYLMYIKGGNAYTCGGADIVNGTCEQNNELVYGDNTDEELNGNEFAFSNCYEGCHRPVDINRDGTPDFVFGARVRLALLAGMVHAVLQNETFNPVPYLIPFIIREYQIQHVRRTLGRLMQSESNVLFMQSAAGIMILRSILLNGLVGSKTPIERVRSFIGPNKSTVNAFNVLGPSFENLVVLRAYQLHFGAGVTFKSSGFTDDTLSTNQVIDIRNFADVDTTTFGNIHANNVGDINDDGFEDIFVGSGFLSTTSSESLNRGWLFLGSESGYPDTPDVTIDFNNDSTITNSQYVNAGEAIEPLGDVNGDGFNDFAVGLTGYTEDFTATGIVYVFYGGDFDQPAKRKVFSNGVPNVLLTSERVENGSYSSFGSQISGGDFNGDGFNDIAVSSLSIQGIGQPLIQVYYGGDDMDGEPDLFPTVTQSDLGLTTDNPITLNFAGVLAFMPSDEGSQHQDLYYTPGAFSGYPDAVIFSGGDVPSTQPTYTLREEVTPASIGMFSKDKPVTGDFNNDGFYDLIAVKQFDGRDALISSRALIFSPNSGINVSVDDQNHVINTYQLSQNFPNPFNPNTTIKFELPSPSIVTLRVFDILGKEVALLVNNNHMEAGSQSISFDASNLASGVYLYRLEAGGFVKTRKMTLIK